MTAENSALAGAARAAPSTGLRGEAAAPGDKSISHRALILGALAKGETSVHGLLEADDVMRTAGAMRALGAEVERDNDCGSPVWRIEGREWRAPERTLYFGNAGTGSRVVMGAVAGQGVAAAFDGDESLRARPMRRILEPLELMGARAESRDGKLPVALAGGKRLHGIDYASPTASAQVKSAVLLAGLGAAGETIVRESEPSRDHTERMLKAFRAPIDVFTDESGRHAARVRGGTRLEAAAIRVPGDPSSAAFLAAAALIVPGSDILIRSVLVNPRRIGFYETLLQMRADLAFENERVEAGEPIADLRVRHSTLEGVEVPAARAPSMIDEYPILSVVAAFASGETYMPGIGELRVKESDRIAASEAALRANGATIDSGPDWMRVKGGGGLAGGGCVATKHDHRIAMSALVMGLAAKAPVEIDDAAMIATSFPSFFSLMTSLGARIERQR